MKRLFVPLWYPPEDSPAGGFYRAQRMIESFRNYEPAVVASDSFPVNVTRILRYPTRMLYSSSRIWFGVIRALNWLWSTLAMIALGLLWRRHFDAVYAGPSEILPISLAGLVVGKIRRIPVVLCNLNVRDTRFWPINKLVHNSADSIITVSNALAQELRDARISKPIAVGTIGVDDLSLPNETPEYDAIFVARLTEAKGIFDLLQIWRLVCDARPGSRLVCAGPATPSAAIRIRETVNTLQLQDVVTFYGPVGGEKWRLYSRSRICVFPSHVEGWGIVPIEAHLAGLPVVAYDLAAYDATIAHSPGATLVRCGDVTAFASTVLGELASPHTNIAEIRAWAQRFTWDSAVAQEEGILDEVLRA